MARWLFKEEPNCFSYSKLESKGETTWDGIKNALALKYLRQVKKGDEIFFYETGKVKAIVGIMRAAADAVLNDKDASVRVVPVKSLGTPVPLSEVKADSLLKSWELSRISRLSIMPVTPEQWNRVLALCKS